MKLRTIIVEDEVLGQEALTGILKLYCDDMVDLVDIVKTVDEAIRSISKKNPHLVFLDINLCGNENGAFEVLQALDTINFSLVFTTSSNQLKNILKAINEHGTMKYLLKPLSVDEVVESVTMAKSELESNKLENEVHEIKDLISHLPSPRKKNILQVPVKQGFKRLDYQEIIMIRSNSNNSLIFLTSGETIGNARNLKYYESHLPKDIFIRVSRSFIINIDHVLEYSKEDGGTILLTNDCTAAISDIYGDDFFRAMGE